ncbi:MAG: hypothetical protein U5K79_01840 [Cyclobacteriaceae bacterium]|nr:hypothetical protein [Cyclobacteriaceae bacterium]
MIRAIVLVVITACFIALKPPTHDYPIAHFTVADSIKIDIEAINDSLEILDKYHARIFTPVCEVDKCYAIEADFYWDLIGRFHHYDTIPGKGLTKLDHIPFTDNDYVKLNYILSNPNSPLASYTKKELVRDVRSSEIDGFTGATINEIKETVIGGAVYSCHTLWHIAHGAVKDSIQQVTRKMFTKELVGKLVNQQDQEINYFLIDNFSVQDFISYLPEVLKTIEDGEGYFAKNAIEKMPNEVVADSLSQRFFAENFSKMNYFAQVALLKKLNGATISEVLAGTLKGQLDDRNSYKNELIQQLIEERNNQ